MIDIEKVGFFDDQTIELFSKDGGTVPGFLGSPTFQGVVAQRRLKQVISSIEARSEGGFLEPQFVWARWILEKDGSGRKLSVYIENPQEDTSVLDRLRCRLNSIEQMNSYPDRHGRIPGHLDWLTLAKDE